MNLPDTRASPEAAAFARGLAMRRAGRDTHAIAWFQEAVRLDPAMGEAEFQAGELCLWHGRAEEAERHLSRAVLWALQRVTPPATGPAAKGMAPDAARQALFAALDAFAQAGIVAFLNGGTVLGCVREGGFIGFDTDIDLGLAPGVAPEPVIEAIDAASGLRYLYHDVHGGQVLRVRFASDHGIGGDIFLYQQDGDGWWCGVQRGPTAVRWRDTPFALATVDFLGRAVLIPDPVERYLTENYGDWRRPDPFHVAAFSAPNLIGGYVVMPRCAAYRAICLALFEGNRARAAHLGREIARRDPGDAVAKAILS
jgi:tetratricopeptide (TPR) repeat protein